MQLLLISYDRQKRSITKAAVLKEIIKQIPKLISIESLIN